MTTSEQFEEKRELERFVITNHAVVLSATTLGQLIDISRDGLAFSYLSTESASAKEESSFELNILCSQDGFYVDNIPCKVIYDKPIADSVPPPLAYVRRRGVQFGRLTPVQLEKLDHFVDMEKHH